MINKVKFDLVFLDEAIADLEILKLWKYH
jgi:hypothetical protein